MAHGAAGLAKLGKKSNEDKPKEKKSSKKKTALKKRTGEHHGVRTTMSGGGKRTIYKSGSGIVGKIEEQYKAGKSIEAIAKSMGKENKDIQWYVNYLRKNDRLPQVKRATKKNGKK